MHPQIVVVAVGVVVDAAVAAVRSRDSHYLIVSVCQARPCMARLLHINATVCLFLVSAAFGIFVTIVEAVVAEAVVVTAVVVFVALLPLPFLQPTNREQYSMMATCVLLLIEEQPPQPQPQEQQQQFQQ